MGSLISPCFVGGVAASPRGSSLSESPRRTTRLARRYPFSRLRHGRSSALAAVGWVAKVAGALRVPLPCTGSFGQLSHEERQSAPGRQPRSNVSDHGSPWITKPWPVRWNWQPAATVSRQQPTKTCQKQPAFDGRMDPPLFPSLLVGSAGKCRKIRHYRQSPPRLKRWGLGEYTGRSQAGAWERDVTPSFRIALVPKLQFRNKRRQDVPKLELGNEELSGPLFKEMHVCGSDFFRPACG
jgi:hypothetical protein